MPQTSPPSILVIGAGITGLSTATLLQKHLSTANITIVAAETPTTPSPSVDYASMWAGAHYRPIHPLSTEQLKEEFRMGVRTAEVMKGIAREFPDSGVELMPGVEYLENPPEEIFKIRNGDVYAGPNDEFRILSRGELPQGAKWGCEYQSYCVNILIYCRWLMDRFLANGGRILQHRLSNAADAFNLADGDRIGEISVVVNCSGRNFDRDPKMKIIRGQTVLVRQQYTKTITRQNADGSWAFLVPRPRRGGTIVGGTKEVDDWEATARPDTRVKLLRQCVETFPDFVDSEEKFEVVQDNVGRRPWREGGYRIEIESVGPGRTVVHGYGAGGRGYELSWGAAERILELVKKSVAARARL
ncbi:uncharacterized protein Z519_09086 [Cladophialophora bantiana CBS 173.52]|uniref:FAD dependent oxidoreductase domain-containing protein n=1 Tax=Cladophialophora bantiana (strain ATCC 10958 / CBS 173.52 / CDC B-1940 / NIH 8579) TaxID=1442370 RepID=A0A0D2HI49_CLAB1|nr:uncharacterized protein Z519_09086 [Cladophialophora bantiana CBS 173.52]KIW90440.1 hypothetical protein Z519_09086 [Cladophialophora bantiana CBS 173.52]